MQLRMPCLTTCNKGGNMIAAVDKGSVIKFISDNHKMCFEPLTATGVSAESIKSLLVKDKMNYVVMETENTGMINTFCINECYGNLQSTISYLDT
jgi:hypothetical protein